MPADSLLVESAPAGAFTPVVYRPGGKAPLVIGDLGQESRPNTKSGEALNPSESDIRFAVGAVADPDLRRGISELGMVGEVSAGRRGVHVDVLVPVEGWPGAQELAASVRAAAIESQGGPERAKETTVTVKVMDSRERAELLRRLAEPPGGEPPALVAPSVPELRTPGGAPRPLGHEEGRPNRFMIPGSRTRVIGVSSGKGGVGKSSVTVNLAVALASMGREVGLLDADVYGFSVPAMLGADRDPVAIGDLLVPPVVHGIRVLSMGFFVPDDQPVVWRGPMLHKALEQFLVDAYWGEPDYLLIDMPPGTGDVALSLGQYLPRTEILVVTTPQLAAQRVAQRSAIAARTLKLSVRGVIENMSWFTGDDGTRYEIFGSGGGQALSDALGAPLLAKLPLVPALRESGDVGAPVAVTDPDGEIAGSFRELAERIDSLGPARIYRSELAVR
jgi:ATP-binding protein involved in chromosome partitioning